MSATFARIKAHPKFGRGLPLARGARAWAALRARAGTAWRAPRVAHVVGSKGKGTTAAFLAALLRDVGLRVGLYTSPHIRAFGERFRLDGDVLPEADLAAAYEAVLAAIGEDRALRLDDFGGFEIMTLMAATLFSTRGLDIAVVEAGIGGRFDPTRLFRGELALLTAIDLEHTALLGSTREAIVADKLDVVGPSADVITGWGLEDLDEHIDTLLTLTGKTRRNAAQAWRYGIAGVRDGALEARITAADGAAFAARFATPAPFLVENALLALEAAHALLGPAGPREALIAAVQQRARAFVSPARFEVLNAAPLIVVDAAHTPRAAARAVEAFAALAAGRDALIAAGVSTDKDAEGVLAALAPAAARFLVFPAAHKGAAPETLAALLRRLNPAARVETAATATQAAARVRAHAAETQTPALITGGLFAAVEFAAAWRGEDPADLEFY